MLMWAKLAILTVDFKAEVRQTTAQLTREKCLLIVVRRLLMNAMLLRKSLVSASMRMGAPVILIAIGLFAIASFPALAAAETPRGDVWLSPAGIFPVEISVVVVQYNRTIT